MGLSESKIAIGFLQSACSEAERNGNNNLTVEFQDTSLIKSLHLLWLNVPDEIQSSIVPQLATKHPRKSLHSMPSRSKTTSTSQKQRSDMVKRPINLPGTVTPDNLAIWLAKPLSFFGDKDDMEFSPISCYQKLLSFEENNEVNIIRSRFIKIVFSRMRDSLQAKRLISGSKNIKEVVQRIKAAGLVDKPEEIEKRVIRWSRDGKKLDDLCRELYQNTESGDRHLSMLFCLPFETEYFRELRLDGEVRKQQIENLRSRGILGLDHMGSLKELAHKISTQLCVHVGLQKSHMITPLLTYHSHQNISNDTGCFTGSTHTPLSSWTANPQSPPHAYLAVNSQSHPTDSQTTLGSRNTSDVLHHDTRTNPIVSEIEVNAPNTPNLVPPHDYTALMESHPELNTIDIPNPVPLDALTSSMVSETEWNPLTKLPPFLASPEGYTALMESHPELITLDIPNPVPLHAQTNPMVSEFEMNPLTVLPPSLASPEGYTALMESHPELNTLDIPNPVPFDAQTNSMVSEIEWNPLTRLPPFLASPEGYTALMESHPELITLDIPSPVPLHAQTNPMVSEFEMNPLTVLPPSLASPEGYTALMESHPELITLDIPNPVPFDAQTNPMVSEFELHRLT